MKFFHNTNWGRTLAVIYAVGVHAAFALGVYFLGKFFSSFILGENPIAQEAGAIFFAVMVFAGAMWAFIYAEYAKEDIDAYKKHSGHDYKLALWAIQGAVAVLELSSLGYRVSVVHTDAERWILAGFGLANLVIAFCLGKVIHAMANRPLETYMGRARQDVTRSLVDDVLKYKSKLTPEEKARFAGGDMSVLTEAMNREEASKGRRTYEELQAEEDKLQAEKQEHEENKSFLGRLLDPTSWGKQPTYAGPADFQDAQPNSQADRLSQNGHH